MNNPDTKVLSRATIQLLLSNQKISEKLSKAKSESKKHEKRGEKWREMWLEEKAKAENLQDLAVKFFVKSNLSCACEDDSKCENNLCTRISSLAKTLVKRRNESENGEKQVEDPENESSSSDSSSDSD